MLRLRGFPTPPSGQAPGWLFSPPVMLSPARLDGDVRFITFRSSLSHSNERLSNINLAHIKHFHVVKAPHWPPSGRDGDGQE